MGKKNKEVDKVKNEVQGSVFIFMNRPRNTVKILRRETGGLVIYHKRLEQGRFEQPIYNNHYITPSWVHVLPKS